jgi:Family of unknown function (DUF6131)
LRLPHGAMTCLRGRDLTRFCCKSYGQRHKLSEPERDDTRGLINRPLKGVDMIFLGVALMIIGIIASIPIFWALGIILLIIGIALELIGMAGHAVGGRRHYY